MATIEINVTTENGYPSVAQVIAAYHIRWSEVPSGFLFAGRTAEKSTPLLDVLREQLESRTKPRIVIEAAAGSGDHTLALASQVEHTHVYAIDTDPKATASMRTKLAESIYQFKVGSRVVVETGDIFGHLNRRKRQRRPLDAFYANSFVHVLPLAERRRLYATISELQPKGGLIAVSFKAEGDAMQGRGLPAGEDERGVYETDRYGLRRLFVRDTLPLQQELRWAGYSVLRTESWSTPDYDIRGEVGRFVGFLAQKG